MTLLLPSVFAASLLGSLHCGVMCGPLVALVSADGKRSGRAIACYQGGRLLAYATLGAIAGGLGNLLAFAPAQETVAALAATTTLGIALLWLSGSISQGSLLGAPGRYLRRLGTALGRRALRVPANYRGLALGLASAFLPCGWLYLYVGAAASTASPVRGALVMGAFWLGAVPLLSALGFGVDKFKARLRGQWLSRAAVFIVLVASATTVIHRLQRAPAQAESLRGAEVDAPSCH